MEKIYVIVVVGKLYFVNFLDFIWSCTLNL